MKMVFTITVAGEESLGEKFNKALRENENLSMMLIQGFAQVLGMTLKLKHDDNFSIESFKAAIITPEEPKTE